MKKIIIILGILMLIAILFTGCMCEEEKPDCVVTRTNGYWSDQYDAYFVQVWVHNSGGQGNVHIGVEITQDGQAYNHFWLNTVCDGCDDMETIRCGDIKKDGGTIQYQGWVRNT